MHCNIIYAQDLHFPCENKETKKAFKKEKDVYKRSDVAYHIAICYERENDIKSRIWFLKVIQNYKDNLKRDCSPYSEVRSIVYFHFGMSYFHLEGDSSDRGFIWLEKAYERYEVDKNEFINYSDYTSRLLYVYGRLCISNRKYSEAIRSLTSFQKVSVNKLDSQELIEFARMKR